MSHHWFCDTDIACFRKARKILKSWSLLRRGSQPFHGSLSQAACLNSETFSDVKDHTLVDNSMKLKLWNLKHSYIALSDFIHQQASLQGTASAFSILSMVQNLSCVVPCRKLCSTPRAGLAKRSVVFGARFKLEQLHGCICSQPLKVADPEWSLESPPGLPLCKSLTALNGIQLTKTLLSNKKSDQAKEQLLNASLAFVESSRGSQGTNSAGVFIWCQIRPYRLVVRRVHPDGIVGCSFC